MSRSNQENINPIQTGSSDLKLNDEDRSYLDRIKTHYEKEIKKHGDESIDIWLKYLEWSDQLYLDKQITKSEIIDLYNRAMTGCKRNKSYQNDPRLLKIFINYITKYEKRQMDWLAWMNQHQYCVKLAQFYIEYSKILESTDRSKALVLLRNALKTNKMDSEQSKIVLDYLQDLRSKGVEEKTENKDDENLISQPSIRCEFAFSYLMLKPNPKVDEEFQFEEIRARRYRAIMDVQKKKDEEIEELKKKLAECESKLAKAERSEIVTNNSTVCPPTSNHHNKTRDMTMNRTNRTSFTNRQSLGTTYNTTAFNNTNLTNVTRFNNEESDDMVLTDDEDEPEFDKTKNKSLAPQAQQSLDAPNFSVTNVDTEYTLADVRNSHMTTFADATTFNRSITARTNEARRMADKMFNQTEATTMFEKSEIDSNTMPSISIYKDPTNLSETQTIETTKNNLTQIILQNDENAEARPKSTQECTSMIADIQSQPMNSFDSSAIEQTTSISKFMEFEPHAASTRSIKPLLKKMNQFNEQNMLETILDSTFDQEVKQLKEQKIQEDEEKEKILEAHLNQTKTEIDKNMSNILAQDFNNTQTIKWSNCTQKTQKQVRFNQVLENEPSQKIASMTGIQWDYSYLEVDSITKKQKIDNNSKIELTQNQTLNSLTIPNITISQPVISQSEFVLEESEPESDKGVLTQQNLEKTFNDDYYKLFYNHSIFNNTSLNVSKVMIDKIIDEEENDEKQNEKENLRNKTIVEEQEMLTTHTNKTSAFTTTALPDLSNSHVSISSSDASMTVPNLNETLMTAIREPFNIEAKNKLLDKGPIKSLKNNAKFASLSTPAPLIRDKSLIQLKDDVNYKVIREIGKGSFAKIYLIERKDDKKKYALKVDRQATSWEFYITENLHERLLKMLEAKEMKINVMDSFIRMNEFIKYQNGCFSAMNFYNNGSLLDLINFHVNEPKYPNFPYWFVLYLTLEMLYIVQYLHKANIIHADIKPDNLIVNHLPDSVSYFDPSRTKCLVLIDFNRSIDLDLLGGSVEFEAKVDNKSLLIPEMKEERPWSFQVDFYGILCSIHCVIFKKYMKTYKEKDRNRIVGSFPRGYDKLFETLFDTYLNVPSCNEFPDIDKNFIENFKRLFLAELGQNFMKSKQYITDLKEHFKPKK
ncbi:unnamed protein product [Brachionus calyciflorus]|uniref:BUB1 n=2 Tax=Brachionus calyciflorus TaxID=104777 RepID=A0A813MF79_9BILA|nr:unnamed protein product [Brachionus calyciflorus]